MCPACILPWTVVILGFFGVVDAHLWIDDNPIVFYTIMLVSIAGLIWGGLGLWTYYNKSKTCDMKGDGQGPV